MPALSGPEEAIVKLLKLFQGAPPRNQVETIPNTSSFFQLIASNAVMLESTTLTSTTNAAYTKLKELIVLRAGTVRVSFQLRITWAGVNAYGRVYINDAAVGTERINGTTTYITYTEDFTINSGDRIQIYSHSDGVRTAEIKTTQLKADKSLEYAEMTLE